MSNKLYDIHMSKNLDEETGTILESADSDDSKPMPKKEKNMEVIDDEDGKYETNTKEDPDTDW